MENKTKNSSQDSRENLRMHVHKKMEFQFSKEKFLLLITLLISGYYSFDNRAISLKSNLA